ncbi:hypothetical protein, partial [Thermomonas alba]|uniref:hypothetical protein n=1 Tax=Thermomonas alba TaxID=2888525 RepID=UPI001F04CA5C
PPESAGNGAYTGHWNGIRGKNLPWETEIEASGRVVQTFPKVEVRLLIFSARARDAAASSLADFAAFSNVLLITSSVDPVASSTPSLKIGVAKKVAIQALNSEYDI